MSFSCDCSAIGASDETYDYCSGIFVVNEDRTCCECGEVILSGIEHETASGTDCELECEGCDDECTDCIEDKEDTRDFWTFHTCIPCMRIRNDFCPGGYWHSGLQDTLIGCIGFDYLQDPADIDDDDDPPPRKEREIMWGEGGFQ